jgi:site-specific DNA-adenine methylase
MARPLLKWVGGKRQLSNADLPQVRKMYSDFSFRTVKARRAINSNASKRGNVGELLIW